jgi:hypothetical protein
VTLDGAPAEATAVGIAADGALLVRDAAGRERRVLAGSARLVGSARPAGVAGEGR